MAETKRTTSGESTPVLEKPTIHTRWLDGSKFIDLDELGKSEVFRRTVKAARKIKTVHASQ